MSSQEDIRRAAALRALAAETEPDQAAVPPSLPGDPGSPGDPARTPAGDGEGRSPRSVGLIVTVVVGVVVIVGAAIAILGSGGDSESTEDVATDSIATPDVSDAPDVSDPGIPDPGDAADDETVDTSAPVVLPPPVGEAAPTLDAGADLDRFTQQLSEYWIWLQANPTGEVEPLFMAGSPAQSTVSALLGSLVGAGRVVVYPDSVVEVTDAHGHGDTADVRVAIHSTERVVLDTDTGDTIETVALPGGTLRLHATLAAGPLGWQVTQLGTE